MLNKDEASNLVSQIKTGLDDLHESVLKLWHGQGWIALNYPTWAELCKAEFPFRLSLQQREERREIEGSLAKEKMSTPAIAEALGVSQTTVDDDLRQLTESGKLTLPPTVIGLDGKERRRPEPKPTPTPEGEQFLQQHLDNSDELRRRELNRKLHADLDKCWGFQKWDTSIAAEAMEDTDITNLNNLITNLQSWRDHIIAERGKTLAIVKEIH